MPDDVSDRSHRGRALFPRPLLLSAVFALLSTLLLAFLLPLWAPGLLRFEHAMGDLRTSWMSDRLPSQHPLIAVVAVTDETLESYKTRLPLDPETERVKQRFFELTRATLLRPDLPPQPDTDIAAHDVVAIVKGMIDAAGEHGEEDRQGLTERVRRAVTGYLATAPDAG